MEGVYYLANLQVESLYKPDKSFANIFPDFPKTITFFMFLKFWKLFSRSYSYYWVIAFSFFY